MAFSRMYLGRHFLGDVIGGVVWAWRRSAVGFPVLQLGHLAGEPRPPSMARASRDDGRDRPGRGALLLGLPDAGDAGRLLGTAIGVLVLVPHDVFEPRVRGESRRSCCSPPLRLRRRVGRDVAGVGGGRPSSASALRLAASALPNAALLIVPALIPARLLRGPLGFAT